jgi:antitoxin MazE
MKAKISNWGNSQGLRFPKNVMETLHLSVGDSVEIKIDGERIVLEPIKEKKQYDINELVKMIPSDYTANEEIHGVIGKEEW